MFNPYRSLVRIIPRLRQYGSWSPSRNLRCIKMLQTVQIKQRDAKTFMMKRIQYLELIFVDLIDKNLCTSFPSFLF